MPGKQWPYITSIIICKRIFSSLSLSYLSSIQKCRYVWESKRGWVSFWIWQNPRNSEGIRIGEVAVHVLGQKCLNCPGTTNVCHHLSFGALKTKIVIVCF